MDYRVREAAVADARAIAVFQTTCWREAYRNLVPQDYLNRVGVDEREQRWRHRLLSAERAVALAELDSAVVGVVSWGQTDVSDTPSLEVMSLYVAAAHRGTGLAAHLLHRAIGDSAAHLWVFRDNPRAQAFYLKQGFRPDGHTKIDDDTGLPEQRLVRTASPP
jgi:GNAT superfamily N-acetyltransferase